MVSILCIISGLGYGENYLQMLDHQNFKYFTK